MNWFILSLLGLSLLTTSGLALEDYAEVSYKKPVREISLIASDEGFYPKSISVFQGERVRFFLTSIASTTSCFVLAEHDLFLAANKGRVTEGEAIFMKAGKEEFYCPANKIRGSITVIKKFRDKPKRTVAGKRNGPWVPKEK